MLSTLLFSCGRFKSQGTSARLLTTTLLGAPANTRCMCVLMLSRRVCCVSCLVRVLRLPCRATTTWQQYTLLLLPLVAR